MKTIEPKLDETKKGQKKVAFGAAGISLFLHLGLLLLVGGVVVVEYAVPRSTMTGELSPVVESDDMAAEALDTPESTGEPDAPEAPSEAAAAPSETAPVDVTVSPINVLSVSTPSTFQVPVALGSPGGTGTGTLGGSGTGTAGTGGKKGKISNPFGGSERLGNGSLEGVFYDLKQTRDKKPSGMDSNKKYLELLADFFKRDWDRKILEKFYQVKDPLYTSLIYMPLMSAGVAPKAFNVENEVQPSQWVIFYEGQFQAPERGQFRFVGYADDVLVVRVNGRVILDGSIIVSRANNAAIAEPMVKMPKQEVVAAHKMGNGSLAYSDWIQFDAGQINKLEILVGERPGGQYCAFLFIEDKSKKYEKAANGRPILPLFRTADVEPNPVPGGEFQKDGPVFGVK